MTMRWQLIKADPRFERDPNNIVYLTGEITRKSYLYEIYLNEERFKCHLNILTGHYYSFDSKILESLLNNHNKKKEQDDNFCETKSQIQRLICAISFVGGFAGNDLNNQFDSRGNPNTIFLNKLLEAINKFLDTGTIKEYRELQEFVSELSKKNQCKVNWHECELVCLILLVVGVICTIVLLAMHFFPPAIVLGIICALIGAALFLIELFEWGKKQNVKIICTIIEDNKGLFKKPEQKLDQEPEETPYTFGHLR